MSSIDKIIAIYVDQVKTALGSDFNHAVLYGSYVRNEYTDESDIDIAIFTDVPSNEFYKLADRISEVTFECNVKYDVILSPVFINTSEYKRFLNTLPYYQSINDEDVAIG